MVDMPDLESGGFAVGVQIPSPTPYAPVTQRNRVVGYEPAGREFESLRAYHTLLSSSGLRHQTATLAFP